MKRAEVERRIAELTSQQWGLFTSAQAHNESVQAKDLQRLANAGLIERVAHGVYRDVGVPQDQHEHLRSIWLSLDPARSAAHRLQDYANDYVVSHSSATQLYQVGDLLEDETVFTTSSRKQSTRLGVRFSRRKLPADLITIKEGLPVTTIERTIVDLIRDDTDLSLVADVLRDANATMDVDYPQLTTLLGSVAQRVGLPRGNGQAVLGKLESIADFIIRPSVISMTVEQREALRNFNTQVAIPDLAKMFPKNAGLDRLTKALTSAASQQVFESIKPFIAAQENLAGANAAAKMFEKSGIGEALASAASRQVIRDIQPLLVQPETTAALTRALAPQREPLRRLTETSQAMRQSMPPELTERERGDEQEQSDL